MGDVGRILSPGKQSQSMQSTATARAAQICRIRSSASRPRRSTRIPSETLSTESRLTAERRGTGSSPGSRTTSLGRPRMVVVQGATRARRWRLMTASRERTTTGLRAISAISHHHTSPRAGRSVMRPRLRAGTTPDRPTRPARRGGASHRRRSSRPPQLHDAGRAERRGRAGTRPTTDGVERAHGSKARPQPSVVAPMPTRPAHNRRPNLHTTFTFPPPADAPSLRRFRVSH